jgi:ribosomal protein S27E
LYSYERHQPENTLLYQIIEKYYPAFVAHLAAERLTLPDYVHQEFEDYLKCGRLEYGFLRVRCEECHHERLLAFSCKRRGFCPSCGTKRMVDSAALLVDTILPHLPMRQWVLSVPFHLRLLFARQPQVMSKVLAIVYRTLSTFLIKKAGFSHKTARTGAVTLIQRFGSALNLNVHFHMLFLDGVYVDADDDKQGQRFQAVRCPTPVEINMLTRKIGIRVARYLERAKLIERDAENCYLAESALGDNEMIAHQGHSIQYRIAVGPHMGKKVFALKALSAMSEDTQSGLLGRTDGFSLHAGVSSKAHERSKLEHLCRYITRPAISEKRLSLTKLGHIRYELKTPYRNGTTHILFEPLDFISKLAALVPVPRVNLTRYHGIFAPHSAHRADIVKSADGKKQNKNNTEDATEDVKLESEKRAAMTWAKRLKRVFDIDITVCNACGGVVKIIACIEDQTVIKQILEHLQQSHQNNQVSLPISRAPPVLKL